MTVMEGLTGRGTRSDLFQSDCSVMLEKTLVWGQGDEEKSLLSSPGGSLDYGGASVSGERDGFRIYRGKNNRPCVMGVHKLREKGVSKLTSKINVSNTFSKFSISLIYTQF